MDAPIVVRRIACQFRTCERALNEMSTIVTYLPIFVPRLTYPRRCNTAGLFTVLSAIREITDHRSQPNAQYISRSFFCHAGSLPGGAGVGCRHYATAPAAGVGGECGFGRPQENRLSFRASQPRLRAARAVRRLHAAGQGPQ